MDRKQSSLFDDSEFRQGAWKASNGLTIVAQPDKKLSKDQRKFNRLAKRIEYLQETIRSDTAELERLLKIYAAGIPARKRLLAGKRVSLAKALGALAGNIKFGKKQREKVRAVILCLCDEAFADIAPDEETERFYNEWADTSYKEELQCQADAMKQELAAQASSIFGIDIDLEDIDDTPEGFARLAERLQNKIQEEIKKEQGRCSRHKKSKKQLEREESRKRDEELLQRSLRSIYLSLAKALHPDTITDAKEKARKEEFMKKVTAAYAGKDLPALLKLELEWVRSENKALDTLPDEELKLYIASLTEQVDALEQELHMLQMHPRYMEIADFSGYPESYAIERIKDMSRNYDMAAKGIDDTMKMLSGPSPKSEIMEFVNDYIAMAKHRNLHVHDFMDDVF